MMIHLVARMERSVIRESSHVASSSRISLPLHPGYDLSLSRDAGAFLDALDLGGTIFEFRDLAEGIERRVGQEVCRGFHKGEWNENHAVGNGVILAGKKLDGPATGRDPDHVARLDAEPCNGAG